jgi:hypothetical protein
MKAITCSPIFIVGMPRSGTKLLRELLNQHSEVSIPRAETNFLPYFAKNFYKYGDLSNRSNFNRFYYDISRTTFFSYIAGAKQIWDIEQWYKSVEATDFSISSVLSAFYELHAKNEQKSIWGDKTPSHIGQIPLIKTLFPSSKIIHIYRDVRDYCLSMRKAWGKNIYRASERWVEDIERCQRDGSAVGSNSYLELQYETLIDNTEKEIRKVCDFCNIQFEKQMIVPRYAVEKVGDAKGHFKVLKGNYNKWKKQLTPKEVRKIEEISGSLMNSLGYSVTNVDGNKKLSPLHKNYYKFTDGLYLFIFQWKETRSFRDCINWIFRYNKYT